MTTLDVKVSCTRDWTLNCRLLTFNCYPMEVIFILQGLIRDHYTIWRVRGVWYVKSHVFFARISKELRNCYAIKKIRLETVRKLMRLRVFKDFFLGFEKIYIWLVVLGLSSCETLRLEGKFLSRKYIHPSVRPLDGGSKGIESIERQQFLDLSWKILKSVWKCFFSVSELWMEWVLGRMGYWVSFYPVCFVRLLHQFGW